MIAMRLSDIEALNRLARAGLQAQGHLPGNEVTLGDRAFATGDEVIALRNDYDIGLLNGTRLGIVGVEPSREALRCTDGNGRNIAVPYTYVTDGHLAHGYAITIHKAQGATIERAYVLADDAMATKHLYTALSRATDRTDLYVDSGHSVEHEAHAPTTLSAQERLRSIGRRSSRQSLAIDLREQNGLHGRGM
jgi:ATP-dependent exoDNAse (exonuclease V) alpha subunit